MIHFLLFWYIYEGTILNGDNKQRNSLAFTILTIILDQKPEYYAYIAEISWKMILF